MLISKDAAQPSKHVRLSAWLEHGPFAYWLMSQLRPKTVVELGTHNGFSFLTFCQAASAIDLDTKIFAVDTWMGDEHAGFYSNDVFDALEIELRTNYPGIGVLLRSTFAEARPQFSAGSIDLLHIDGRHRYEDVREDFLMWMDALSDRGVVLFHDTCVQTSDFGVWRFWSELRREYPCFEFFHGNGLGVMILGANVPSAVRALTMASSDEQSLVRSIYARLGSLNTVTHQLDATRQHLANVDKQCELLTADRDRLVRELSLTSTDRDNLHGNVQGLSNELALLRKSTSWRVTAPYRWAGHQGKRARHVMRVLPLMAKRQGGYLNLARKASSIMAREGLSGARLAWRNSNAQTNTSSENDYEKWLRTYATLDDAARARVKSDIAGFEAQPLISIVMPVYNAEPNWLAEAIDSVRNQLYPHWELCIADDRSTSAAVRPVLERYAAIDSRIKVFRRPVNGHISEASNSAIELATGDWMALLDQDDLLSEDALFYVARTINEKPQVELIYSDEDKISNGKRFDPYFKSDWNPDLLRSQNMISHLGVYKLDRVRSIGGFRKGYEGAQDHDLVLRFTDQLSEEQVAHIPRVLYHWRSHSSSTAQSGGNKSYAALAGQKALNDHLARKGISGRVEILPTGMYRVFYDLPENPPLVSLIIPTRNGLQLLRKCVESILQKTDYPNYEILIIDNNSDDPATLEYFRQIGADSRVSVMRDEQPFNYSAINNGAVSKARGDFVGLINNDIEVISPNWLSEMMSHAVQAGVGAVGARLWYPDDRLQHGGVLLGIGGVANHAHLFHLKGAHGYFSRAELVQTFSAVTAACFVIRKSIYEAVGGLDEHNLKVAFNDVDFCLRVRESGWRNVWTPFAELYHHESATRGLDDTPEKKERFRREVMYMLDAWGDKLASDPAYNPNLTLDRTDFSLAWPPRNQSDPTLAS